MKRLMMLAAMTLAGCYQFNIPDEYVLQPSISPASAPARTPSTSGPAAKVETEDRYFTHEYKGSEVEGELPTPVTYTMWVPGNVKTLRGIIVHQHGAGTTASIEGSTAAYDLHWQALARKWDCVLLSSSYHVTNEKVDLTPGGSEWWFDPRRGSERAFYGAIDDFAVRTGHMELARAPWILWGHSGSGIWADIMTNLHPNRVIAVFARSGTAAMFRTHPEFPQPTQIPDAVYQVPMMVNPGVKEKNGAQPPRGKESGPWWGNLATAREYREHGALVSFAPDPRTGHECGDSRYLAIPFFDACMALRLPEVGAADQTPKPMDVSKAWVSPILGDKAMPAAEYKGDLKDANWFPNETVAKAWEEYVKTGAVGDPTPPSAPFDVKATRGEKGWEVTWNAYADLESGVRQFVVYRDGKEIARVPEKPEGKFGRPLFQSMTYHDTPSQPLPKMRYVDAGAGAGEQVYTVEMVNGVGLKSVPSGPSRGK